MRKMKRTTMVLWWFLVLCLVATDAMMGSPSGPCEARGCVCNESKAICKCNKDVQTISLSSVQSSYMRTIQVTGCRHVHFAEYTLRNLTMLSRIEIRDVHELVLAPRSFHAGHLHKNLDIRILNTGIEKLPSYAFQGNISQITIERCNITQVEAYAFTSLTAPTTEVTFMDSRIERIATQAFKRIQLTSFTLLGTEIASDVPSKMLNEVEVMKNFVIADSKFRTIKSSAFNVMLPRSVEIVNSRFGALEGDAFMIIARGQITFKNNAVGELHKGAFAGLDITKDILRLHGAQDFIFYNNTIGSITNGSLWTNATSIKPRFNQIRLTEKCSCKLVDQFAYSSVAYCTVEPQPRQGNEIKYQSLEKMLALECRDTGFNSMYTWLIVFFCLFALTLGGGLMIWLCRRHRNKNQKKWINNAVDEKNPNIVLPEPRTYRETEVHVIVERAELLTTDL